MPRDKMNKPLADWAKVTADAVMGGSRAQAVNVLTMALQDIQRLGQMLDEAETNVESLILERGRLRRQIKTSQ